MIIEIFFLVKPGKNTRIWRNTGIERCLLKGYESNSKVNLDIDEIYYVVIKIKWT